MSDKYLVLYHGNCADGFTSAWVVREWAKITGIPEQNIEYEACFYNKAIKSEPAGKRVLMVDFSLRKEAILDMANMAESIHVIDHHKSAQEELSGEFPPNVLIDFDMTRSGASLAWELLIDLPRGLAPPELVRYVADRDLWKFDLPKSAEITEYIFSFEYTFENWDKIADKLDNSYSFNSAVIEGAACLRKKTKDIAEMLEAGTLMLYIQGYRVPCCNLPYMWGSDGAHELLKRDPEAAFAGYWWIDNEGVHNFGLRSENSREDVSKIAREFGGGGHRNAAGFKAYIDGIVIVPRKH